MHRTLSSPAAGALAALMGCSTVYRVDPEALAAIRQRAQDRASTTPIEAAPIEAMDGERRTHLPESVVLAHADKDGVLELYDERHAIRGWGYGSVAAGSVMLLGGVTFAATGSELAEEAWPWAASGAAIALGTGLLLWAFYSDGPEVEGPPPELEPPPAPPPVSPEAPSGGAGSPALTP